MRVCLRLGLCSDWLEVGLWLLVLRWARGGSRTRVAPLLGS